MKYMHEQTELYTRNKTGIFCFLNYNTHDAKQEEVATGAACDPEAEIEKHINAVERITEINNFFFKKHEFEILCWEHIL